MMKHQAQAYEQAECAERGDSPMNSLCVRNETPKRHMKFVVVNGRTPRPQSFCALCCKSIGGSYLRELTTRLSYCDDLCYAGKCKVAAPMLQKHARRSEERRVGKACRTAGCREQRTNRRIG